MGTHLLNSPPQGCVNILWQDVAIIHFNLQNQVPVESTRRRFDKPVGGGG